MINLEDKILTEVKGMLIPLEIDPNGADNSYDIHAHNEAIVDVITRIEELKSKSALKDGQARLTVGHMGGTETSFFNTVNEAVETLSHDYTGDLSVLYEVNMPLYMVHKLDKHLIEEKSIGELFIEAHQKPTEKWAEFTLDNSDDVANAWLTGRCNKY